MTTQQTGAQGLLGDEMASGSARLDDGSHTLEAGTSGHPGRSSEGGMRERVEEVKGQVKAKTEELKTRAEELRSEAETRADSWTTSLGEQMERVARAVRVAGDALEDEGEGRLSAVSSTMADQVQRVGGYLKDEDPRAMIEDLETQARRNPAVFVGSVFVAGLLLGRFFRASAR